MKRAKIGHYGHRTTDLRMRLSYERIAHTHKTALVYKYLGPATSDTPSIDEIPDPIFMEVRDRTYDTVPEEINISIDAQIEGIMDLSKYGIISPVDTSLITIRIHLLSYQESELGRFLVPGDILEIPYLVEDFANKELRAFFEVKDVDNKQINETFTSIVHIKPMKHEQQTFEIDNENHNDGILDILSDQIIGEAQEDVPTEAFGKEEVTPFERDQDLFIPDE